MFHLDRLTIIELMNLKYYFFYFNFLSIDTSVNIYDMDLTFPVCVFKVLLKGNMCQIVH